MKQFRSENCPSSAFVDGRQDVERRGSGAGAVEGPADNETVYQFCLMQHGRQGEGAPRGRTARPRSATESTGVDADSRRISAVLIMTMSAAATRARPP